MIRKATPRKKQNTERRRAIRRCGRTGGRIPLDLVPPPPEDSVPPPPKDSVPPSLENVVLCPIPLKPVLQPGQSPGIVEEDPDVCFLIMRYIRHRIDPSIKVAFPDMVLQVLATKKYNTSHAQLYFQLANLLKRDRVGLYYLLQTLRQPARIGELAKAKRKSHSDTSYNRLAVNRENSGLAFYLPEKEVTILLSTLTTALIVDFASYVTRQQYRNVEEMNVEISQFVKTLLKCEFPDMNVFHRHIRRSVSSIKCCCDEKDFTTIEKAVELTIRMIVYLERENADFFDPFYSERTDYTPELAIMLQHIYDIALWTNADNKCADLLGRDLFELSDFRKFEQYKHDFQICPHKWQAKYLNEGEESLLKCFMCSQGPDVCCCDTYGHTAIGDCFYILGKAHAVPETLKHPQIYMWLPKFKLGTPRKPSLPRHATQLLQAAERARAEEERARAEEMLTQQPDPSSAEPRVFWLQGSGGR